MTQENTRPAQRAARSGPSSDSELLSALVGSDARADLAVARTRRVVQNTVIDMEEQRQKRRRKTGIALFAVVLSVTLLAPALWSSMEAFVAGAHFGDFQTQIYLLGVTVLPGVLAAAIAGFTLQQRHHRS